MNPDSGKAPNPKKKEKSVRFPLLFLVPVCRRALWLLLHLPSLCWGFTDSEGVSNTYDKYPIDFCISALVVKLGSYFPSYRFFLSIDLCVAAERIILSLGHLAFSCRLGTVSKE